jgi:hypothetical protein
MPCRLKMLNHDILVFRVHLGEAIRARQRVYRFVAALRA